MVAVAVAAVVVVVDKADKVAASSFRVSVLPAVQPVVVAKAVVVVVVVVVKVEMESLV